MNHIRLFTYVLISVLVVLFGITGFTGGLASELGVRMDSTTLKPVSATDALARVKYAGINTVSGTAVDVAILGKGLPSALTSNLRSNIGTQIQAAGSSAIGSSYASGGLAYLEHKGLHAALGGASAAISHGDPLSGALGAATAEAVGEQAFINGFNPETSANIAKVAGSTIGLATKDVTTAASSAATATDNNLVPLILAVGTYVALTGEGNPLDGVEKIGAGEDLLSRGIEKAMQKGVELSYEKYPKETEAVLGKLSELGESVDAVVRYTDDKTGNVTSAKWAQLSKSKQNQLKGALSIISIIIPAQKTWNLPKISELAKKIAPNEIPNGKVKVGWSKGNMPQGMPWEDFVGTSMPKNSRLPNGFKTFDYFDRTTGIATSAKTLDTLTPSKLNNPKQIYSTLKMYIDKTANFTEDVRSKRDVSSSIIKSRQIELAVPNGTTSIQYKEIEKAIKYAKDKGVELNVTRLK